MRLPEFLFPAINAMMVLFLRSPLHGLASGSLMLISYRGRRTGRRYTTPVRYLRAGGGIRCFSDQTTKWWRNLLEGAEVTLRVGGVEGRYRATAYVGDPARIRPALSDYLRQFPQDAAYHHVRLGSDRQPLAEDLDRAAAVAAMVEAVPLTAPGQG